MFISLESVDSLGFYSFLQHDIIEMVTVSRDAFFKAMQEVFNSFSLHWNECSRNFHSDSFFKFFQGVWTMFKDFMIKVSKREKKVINS